MPSVLPVAATARLVAGGRASPPGAFVFAYHDVRPGPPATPYDVTPDLLAKHIRWARGWGVRFVPLAELVDRLAAGSPVAGLAAITFDDALGGVHDHAAGVLAEMDAPATVFVVSARLGLARPPWWEEAGRTVTPSELDALVAAGVTIGSHTRTHATLPVLDDAALDDELRGSRADLKQRAGAPVDLLAYPDGHHDGQRPGRGRGGRLPGRVHVRQRPGAAGRRPAAPPAAHDGAPPHTLAARVPRRPLALLVARDT